MGEEVGWHSEVEGYEVVGLYQVERVRALSSCVQRLSGWV